MKLEQIRKLLYGVDVLLVAGLALAVVSVVRAAGTPADDGAIAVPAAAQAAPGVLSDQEFASIIDSGSIVPKAAAPDAVSQAQENVSAADFEYKLIGTAIHETSGFAFLEGPGRVQKVGSVGDTIGNARLVRVTEDEAFFDRGGQAFSLKREIRVLKSDGSATPFSPGAVVAAQGSPAGASLPEAMAQVASAGAAAGQEQTGENAEGAVTEEDIEDPDSMVMTTEQYKSYLENIGKYTGEIIILSHYGPDGKLDGLLLAKVPKESEAWKRGLKEGDIVKAVQGVPVTDPSTASKVAWDVYKNADYTLELEIIRNGEEETLMYEIWPQE